MKHEPRQADHMEKALEIAWVGPQVGWGVVSGNHQGKANGVSQVEEDSDMAPTCQLCGAESLCQHFCLGES